jgi:hypothetical protein
MLWWGIVVPDEVAVLLVVGWEAEREPINLHLLDKSDNAPPEHFNKMPVPGEAPTYWSVKAKDFSLTSEKGSVPLAFDGECIIDSGTSLTTLKHKVNTMLLGCLLLLLPMLLS